MWNIEKEGGKIDPIVIFKVDSLGMLKQPVKKCPVFWDQKPGKPTHDTKGCSRFCMILRDNRRNLEVCICTPDTLATRAWLKFHTSVEIGDDLLWKGHVMCANARYWSNSDNIADFQQNFTFFRYFSWQEVILVFFYHTMIMRGSDWYWAILKRMTMVPLIQ